GGAAAGHEHDRALEFSRVGHELHAWHAADLVLGLHRERGLALGDALRVVAAAAIEHELGLDLTDDAEPRQYVHEMHAADAAGCGIGDQDGLGGEQGVPEGIGRAHVGFRRPNAHRHAETDANHRDHRASLDV